MSLLLVDEVLAAGVGEALEGVALQAAIDREEAWLARRIGQLEGERTERFPLVHIRPTTYEVHLRRPTDEVAVTEGGTDVSATCELRHYGWRVAKLPEGTHFLGVLECTYTPNDADEVQGALLELLSLRLGTTTSAGLAGEIMGSYSYTRAQGSSTRIRESIVRSLSEPAGASSVRTPSSVLHGLAGQVGR